MPWIFVAIFWLPITCLLFVLAVCCPENTYGPDCKECVGGAERPCTGNGNCEVSNSSSMTI